jgi:3-hydroxy-9,10-secoandrosta-1,3,5(10)-triene-9,17-dione monooxygenase
LAGYQWRRKIMGQVLDNISQFADEIRADGVEGDKLMR